MTTLRKAAEMALEALNNLKTREPVEAEITALRTALDNDQPFGYFQYALRIDGWVLNRDSNKGVAFYLAPPQRNPLTDAEIEDLSLFFIDSFSISELKAFARAIERTHGVGGGK